MRHVSGDKLTCGCPTSRVRVLLLNISFHGVAPKKELVNFQFLLRQSLYINAWNVMAATQRFNAENLL